MVLQQQRFLHYHRAFRRQVVEPQDQVFVETYGPDERGEPIENELGERTNRVRRDACRGNDSGTERGVARGQAGGKSFGIDTGLIPIDGDVGEGGKEAVEYQPLHGVDMPVGSDEGSHASRQDLHFAILGRGKQRVTRIWERNWHVPIGSVR